MTQLAYWPATCLLPLLCDLDLPSGLCLLTSTFYFVCLSVTNFCLFPGLPLLPDWVLYCSAVPDFSLRPNFGSWSSTSLIEHVCPWQRSQCGSCNLHRYQGVSALGYCSMILSSLLHASGGNTDLVQHAIQALLPLFTFSVEQEVQEEPPHLHQVHDSSHMTEISSAPVLKFCLSSGLGVQREWQVQPYLKITFL